MLVYMKLHVTYFAFYDRILAIKENFYISDVLLEVL